ncbi:energy-coupling factor transporter transmembrane component T family protein [Paenibacillus marinisediminis]
MKLMSLYVERESMVHHIDPITKLVYIATIIALPIVLPSIHTAWICMLISFAILGAAGVIKQSLPIFGFVGFVLLTVVLIQGFFYVGNETVLFHLGSWPFYEEGLLFALGIAFRALNIVGAFLILVLTTKPSDLVDSLVRKGLSPRIGYVLNSVFQIIPQMMSTVDTIMDAQRSRGMETEGKLITRIKAFLPLIGPVVLSSLIDTKERTLALQVRGFNVKGAKTFLNEEKKYRHGLLLRWFMLAVLVGAVIWRLIA